MMSRTETCEKLCSERERGNVSTGKLNMMKNTSKKCWKLCTTFSSRCCIHIAGIKEESSEIRSDQSGRKKPVYRKIMKYCMKTTRSVGDWRRQTETFRIIKCEQILFVNLSKWFQPVPTPVSSSLLRIDLPLYSRLSIHLCKYHR